MKKQIGDLLVNYHAAGAGFPLVLLHGMGARAQCFEETLPLLAKDFGVYAFDLRGAGTTVRPPGTPLSDELWRDDTIRFLDSFDLSKVVLAGWSLGALIAINVALAAPERVSHLVLMGAPSGPSGPKIDRSGFEERRKLIESGAPQAEIVAKTFEYTKTSMSQKTRAEKPEVVEKVRQEHLSNDPKSYLEMLRVAGSRKDFSPRLHEITCPTLILCGDEDARTPVAHSIFLNRLIPRSYLKVIPNCGHHYGYEQPEATSRSIVEFVQAFG